MAKHPHVVAQVEQRDFSTVSVYEKTDVDGKLMIAVRQDSDSIFLTPQAAAELGFFLLGATREPKP